MNNAKENNTVFIDKAIADKLAEALKTLRDNPDLPKEFTNVAITRLLDEYNLKVQPPSTLNSINQ